MPLIEVGMFKGKSAEFKKTILDCIQRITEYDRDSFEYPSFKSDNFMIIELTLFPGRTKEQKGKAVEAITTGLQTCLSIDPSDVFIIINEPPLENWGMGGQLKG